MIWGCFSGVGQITFVPVKGNLNATVYHDIFDNSMLPILWEQFGEGPFCSSMTVPVLKARSIKARSDKFSVKKLDWPTQSPGLNPTEHLCGELEWRLRAYGQTPCLTS